MVYIVYTGNAARERRVIKTADSLKKAGFNVKLVSGFCSKDDIEQSEYEIECLAPEYNPTWNLLKKLLYKYKFMRNIKKYFKDKNPEYIHACNIDMLAGVMKYAKKTKIIYDSYEICSSKSGAASNKLTSIMIKMMEKRYTKKIYHMICVSNAAKKYFIDEYNISNISVVSNTPIVNKVYSKKEKHSPLRILYLGGFFKNRGIEEFILSAKYLKDVDCILQLRGFGSDFELYKKIISDNQLEDKVTFLPLLAPENILDEIYLTSDVGIVLTKNTNLNHKLTVSNKIFDYVNTCLPSIMSNVDEHEYINKQYEIGIILDEVNENKIAETIKNLVNDDKLYNKLSGNCEKFADKMQWKNDEKILLEIYGYSNEN